MVKVIGIDHLAIRVSDLDRSKQFYGAVLGFLGFEQEWAFDRVVGWTNGDTMFWITEADAKGQRHRHHTGDIGYHHYAFEVGSQQDVDALYEFLLTVSAVIADVPTDYPSYGEGYYAVFFLDPDGLKLEVMTFLEKQKRRAFKAKSAS